MKDYNFFKTYEDVWNYLNDSDDIEVKIQVTAAIDMVSRGWCSGDSLSLMWWIKAGQEVLEKRGVYDEERRDI